MRISIHHVLAAVLASTVLAGCGGDGHTADPADVSAGSELPASALQGIDGLVAWANDQITNRTDSTGNPILLGDAVLPTSDTREPI